MRQLAYLFAGLAAVSLAIIAFARSGGLGVERAQAVAMFGRPPSQFLEIDGALLHFRDEGAGPPLVLLHGSRASLHQWDGWVNELKDELRIIRVDGGSHGLSGTDRSDDYSPDRQNFLLAQFLDHLNVQNVFLGGTSSGAITAVRFAAEHPERVSKLVLSTVPLKLPATATTPPYRRFVYWLHSKVLGTTATKWYWRNFLENIFADPGKVTESMAVRYRILNSLPEREREQRLRIDKWYELGGPDRDFEAAGRVTTPVLVQWGAAGPVLPKEIQCEITAAFKNAEVRVIAYPDLGHKLMMEDPTRTARDAARYINGEAVGGRCDAT
jgi:pimeloyl-ACP methyl ester carboxylesterase